MPVSATLSQLGVSGPTMGEISGRYPTYVVPAGYAFSIWNLIFLLCLGYGVWQFSAKRRSDPLLRRIGWCSAWAFFAATIWVPVFQQSYFALSVLVMLTLLASLIFIMSEIYRSGGVASRAAYWLVYVNFSVFLGWITAATIANIGQTLTAYGWTGWGIEMELWGVIVLAATGLIGATVTTALKGNVPYALTVIWALAATAVNQYTAAVPTHSFQTGSAVVIAAMLVALSIVFHYARRGHGRDVAVRGSETTN